MSVVKLGRAGADEWRGAVGGWGASDGGGVFNLLACMHKQNDADYWEP